MLWKTPQQGTCDIRIKDKLTLTSWTLQDNILCIFHDTKSNNVLILSKVYFVLFLCDIVKKTVKNSKIGVFS